MDDDDHPLVLELNSLRETAARFQHEAHAAAIKLQRHSLEASRTHEHAAALEQENARLTHEIKTLRAHPDIPPHPAVAQVQELTLALRRVSDKIILTENTLLECTTELAHVRNDLSRAKHVADEAYELAAHMRAREETAKARERELELKARASEEECKMVDLVIQEYADLVRTLEGRKSANHIPSVANGSPSVANLADTLQADKSNLHGMVTAFSAESDNLYATIAELNARVSTLQMTLDAERLAASNDRTLLSQTKTELDKLNLEDQTAAKMVARYMKFSQASTNALQEQIMTLKTRHASTISTLDLQLSITDSQLASERARTARLQDALDELCEDLARESYGRRREVALRLALLSREEGIAEFMRRWARRARELFSRCYDSTETQISSDSVQEAFYRVVSDAESLLSTLDDDVNFSDGTRTSGSLARIAISRAAVDTLRSELQDEVRKRVEAIRKNAFPALHSHLNETTPSGIDDLAQPENKDAPDQLLLTPNGNVKPEHETLPTVLPQPQHTDLFISIVGAPEEIVNDPFVVSAPVASPDVEISEHTITQRVPSPIQDNVSTSTSTSLLVEEPKAVHSRSPAVCTLDLREELHSFDTEELLTTGVVPNHVLPGDTPVSDTQVPAEDDASISPTLLSTPTLAISHTPPELPEPPALLSKLGATKHRYDDLQRAFRDCSLALKELKRTLASSSPSQTKLHHHLETALARIDDYAEDARVELEIRIADEELTIRGFEMVLSVPGALADADERVEVEASAWEFVDGTDEGVARVLDKFRKKLEDVQHDVAVVKRAVHRLAMEGEDEEIGEVVDEEASGGGWTAWTAGLLGANTTPSRSPTPVQTFGTVMTSPRLRHAASLKQLHGSEGVPDRGPLAGLNLRIPMPSALPSPWTQIGLGQPTEETRPRTLSAMYAVGGLRSSSVGLGVGLGGSPSPARMRSMSGLGMRMGNTSSPLCVGDVRNDNVDDTPVKQTDREGHDFGEVE